MCFKLNILSTTVLYRSHTHTAGTHKSRLYWKIRRKSDCKTWMRTQNASWTTSTSPPRNYIRPIVILAAISYLIEF